MRSVLKEVKGVVDVQLDCRRWTMKVAFKPDADVKQFKEIMNKKSPFKITEMRASQKDEK